jgi:aryl-alcohol dehydrogenase-like predicted oxidoreductase
MTQQMRPIGSTGINVTPVAMGCWPITGISSVDVTEEQSLATLQSAFDSGINFFDSAFVYGHNGESEKMIARVLGSHRDEIVIATKAGLFWKDGKITKDGRPTTIVDQCHESLRRLSTDVIDLYYLHGPDPDVPVAESAAAFERLKQAGKIRAVGVSNFTLKQMQQFHAVCQIDAIQPYYNMLQREIETEILPWCKQNTVSAMVYWPLLKGLLAGKLARDHVFPDQDGRKKYAMFQGDEYQKNLNFVDQLRPIAADFQCDIPSLVIAWTIAQPGITAALCGAKRPEQIEQTSAAMRLKLTADVIGKIGIEIKKRGPTASRSAL